MEPGVGDASARRVAARAVPTDALLTTDGRWIDEQTYGDLGYSSTWDRYFAFADGYLDGLGERDILVRVRVHF